MFLRAFGRLRLAHLLLRHHHAARWVGGPWAALAPHVGLRTSPSGRGGDDAGAVRPAHNGEPVGGVEEREQRKRKRELSPSH